MIESGKSALALVDFKREGDEDEIQQQFSGPRSDIGASVVV